MKSMPLSPRLSVYAWHLGAIASIAHRATGLLMVLSIPLYLWLIFTMTGSPEEFQHGQTILHSVPGRLMLWLSGVVLVYHLLNGIRFLCLDAGWGERRSAMRQSARGVFALSVAAALILAVLLW